MGESAVLIPVTSQEEAFAMRAAVTAAAAAGRIAGLVDVVVGEHNVVIVFDPLRLDPAAVVAIAASAPALDRRHEQVMEIPVVYDGADLRDVAEQVGHSVGDVVRRHGEPLYTAAFIGFSPGFAYLTGLDTALHLPRRDTPRERVPPGSVAMAGPYTSVYPQATPGGWWLLGHTSVRMFDVRRAGAESAVAPGDRVRFVPAGDPL